MAFIDSRALADGTLIERDLCIIGAGPAGIAIAREFIKSGMRVALLESGDVAPDDGPQGLAAGESIGLPYPPLDKVRIRAFGGSTWHWGGNIRPLEEIDFEERDWIPHSGWPIGRDILDPYYKRARPIFGVPDTVFDEDIWRRVIGSPWDTGNTDKAAILNQLFHTVGGAGRFSGDLWRDPLEKASALEIYHHATAMEVTLKDSHRSVSEIPVRTANGRNIRFRAKAYVLAAGGIETPRFLLMSNRQESAGVGNRADLVGRYFMEHLTVPNYARFYPANTSLPLGYYRGVDRDWGETWGILRMSDREMRDHHLPNVRFQISSEINEFNKDVERPGMQSLRTLLGLQTSPKGDDLGRHIANMIADIDQVADAAWYRILHHPNYPLRYVDVVHIGEQTPNPDSRVKLSSRRDHYGQQMCSLDWRIQRLDSDGAWRTAQRLKVGLAKAGLGRLDVNFDKSVFAKFSPKPHFHHMGTTRMHDDPAKGVVDVNCRVHGLGNLFIAGSSVFPTGGNANPTLTLTALAIRLADHLKKELT